MLIVLLVLCVTLLQMDNPVFLHLGCSVLLAVRSMLPSRDVVILKDHL